MPAHIIVTENIKEVKKYLTKIQKKQLPYATSVAMKDTIWNVQQDLWKHTSSVFQNKKVWWKNKVVGINRKHDKKNKWPNIGAEVWTNAHFAKLQEEGGIKRPFAGKSLLIPTNNAPKYARKSGGHKKVFAHKKTLTKGKSGSPFFNVNGQTLVLQRKGKKRHPLKAVYVVEDTARIKPHWNFEKTAAKTTLRKFDYNFHRALKRAISSAR